MDYRSRILLTLVFFVSGLALPYYVSELGVKGAWFITIPLIASSILTYGNMERYDEAGSMEHPTVPDPDGNKTKNGLAGIWIVSSPALTLLLIIYNLVG